MKKILVIDDIEVNLILMECVLNKYLPECTVLKSQNALEGIQIARQEQPDMILLDLHMPQIDGYEACKMLKNENSTRQIPIIICTAELKNSEHIVKGLSLGADAFLTRPIKDKELCAQVRVMLRIKQAEDDLKNEMEKYRIMAETLPDAITTINLHGEITYVSPRTIEIFGFNSFEDIVGMNIINTIVPEYHHKAQKILQKVLKENTVRDFELKFVKHNGSEFYGDLSAALIKNSHGEPREIIIITKDITERKNNENEILDYQKKLKKMNLELSRVEESERRKIALNLHDGLGQTLSIAHIKLSSLENKPTSPKVDNILKESTSLLLKAIKESRSLTYDLSPPILFELGLIPALEWRLEQIKDKFEMATEFKCSLKLPQISNDINILLYRIICELLLNAIKHAEAGMLIIEIYKDKKNTYFNIIDNGKGYSYPPRTKFAKQSGLGLFSIKEKLDSIHGHLQIESVKFKGTKASIIIPNF